MSGTFEKIMKNRDYWRDEAKAGWAKIEALEAENHELQLAKDEAVAKERRALRNEIKRLQQQADERLESYAERTYQLIRAQRELEKWQLLMINHTMGGTWESVADFIKDQRPAVFSLPSDRWAIKLEDADDVRMAEARARLKSPGQEVRQLEDALTQGFATGMETGQWYQVTDDGPAKVELVNLDPLSKAAQKVAQAFENLAKRASETISENFQR